MTCIISKTAVPSYSALLINMVQLQDYIYLVGSSSPYLESLANRMEGGGGGLKCYLDQGHCVLALIFDVVTGCELGCVISSCL